MHVGVRACVCVCVRVGKGGGACCVCVFACEVVGSYAYLLEFSLLLYLQDRAVLSIQSVVVGISVCIWKDATFFSLLRYAYVHTPTVQEP